MSVLGEAYAHQLLEGDKKLKTFEETYHWVAIVATDTDNPLNLKGMSYGMT